MLQAVWSVAGGGGRWARRNRRRNRDTEAGQEAELLQTAENGRYKVVAKAEPYKNLPVSYEINTDENCTWK